MSKVIDKDKFLKDLQARKTEFHNSEIETSSHGYYGSTKYWNGRKESVIDIINKIERGDYDKAD